jgi:hypothetical protein
MHTNGTKKEHMKIFKNYNFIVCFFFVVYLTTLFQ